MTTQLHIYLTATTIHVLTTNCSIFIGSPNIYWTRSDTYILIQSGFQPFDFYWDNDDDDDV